VGPPSLFQEKRRFRRYPYQTEVFFKPFRKSNQMGIVKDVSEEGTYLISSGKLTKGTEIILYLPIEMNDSESLCFLQGRVVRSEPVANDFGYGIQFYDLTPGTLSILRKFLQKKFILVNI
jgi:hypothetical protein